MLPLQRRLRIGLLFLVATLPWCETSWSRAEELIVRPVGLNAIVKMAVLEAHRRLEDPQCREIFSDFNDPTGRTLRDGLHSLGQTGQSYLGWIQFRDGALSGRCAEPGVLAFTAPGSRVVFFCGEQFTRQINRRGLGSLAISILHEELHSLGLGENPPSAQEITRRVETRCGL